MKKIYTISVFLFLLNQAFSQVAIEWQKCLGGSNSDNANSIIQTLDLGYIVIGSTLSSDGDVTTNYGGWDIWVVKLDSAGNIQWQKSYGGSNHDHGSSILQTPDQGYVFVGTTWSNDFDVSGNHQPGFNDVWVVKLDGPGNIQWQKCFGGTANEWGDDIKLTRNNGLIIAASTNSLDGDVSTSYGGVDYWIFKLDSSGTLEWEKSFGGTLHDWAFSIDTVYGHQYIIIGKNHPSTALCNLGQDDILTVKIDSMGNTIWQKCMGGSSFELGEAIIQDQDHNFLMVSRTNSNDGQISGYNGGWYDSWIVKLDTAGNIIWEDCLGGTNDDQLIDLVQTRDGGYILSGWSNSNDVDLTINYGANDYWIARVNSEGNIIWQNSFGGSGNDGGTCSIYNTNDNGLILAGSTDSNDGDVAGNHGLADYWIVKFTNNFNLIKGKTFVDSNNNFIQDLGEHTLSNKLIYETNTNRTTITQQSGYYNLTVVDTGSFNVTTSSMQYYQPLPVFHSSTFLTMLQTDSLKDFAFQPLGVFNDLQITISPVGPFRPGFDAHYNIHYKNVGTTSLQGTIKFYPDPVLTYVSSSLTPQSIANDSIIWQTPLLNPFDEGDIFVTVNIDASTPIGLWIDSWAKIEPVNGDANPSDNVASWRIQTTGSFDPNDILVNRDSILTTELANPPYLEYLIRFQNTGNDTAFTVKIKNELPSNLQLTTFEFVNSSHPVQLNYSNEEEVMWFKFENILLPDSNTNELLSHGFVRYRIKPFDTLAVGDLIENTAAIYFDFNAPVITNTAVTEIVLPTFIPTIKEDFNFSLYPNPTTGELNITFTLKETSAVKIELFNSLGQIVKTIADKKLNSGENKINFFTENIPKGIYHLKFSVDGNVVAKKVVKM